MRILVFGDSIAWGASDTQGGWVARLDRMIKMNAGSQTAGAYPQIYNLSISGETIHGTLERFEAEANSRRGQHDLAIVFAVGVNDTLIEDDTPWCEVAAVEHDLRELLEKSHRFSGDIFFLGPVAVDESRTRPVSWGNYVYTQARIDEFEAMYQKVSDEQKVTYISLREVFTGRPELLSDGLHPTDQGHEVICQLVCPKLDEHCLLQIR